MANVWLPMMPIGVEHSEIYDAYVGGDLVWLPMMPIGVEHVLLFGTHPREEKCGYL